MKNLEITENNITEYTPTESTAARIMYIINHLANEPKHDLKINKTDKLKSTFIELMNSKNRIFGLVVFTGIHE